MNSRQVNPIRVLLMLAALAVLAAFILYPVIVSARPIASRIRCLSNMKQMSIALQMYRVDHDDGAPVDAWMDRISNYAKPEEPFRCPDVAVGVGYGFNAFLAGKRYPLEPEATVAIADTAALERNAQLAAIQPIGKGRHEGRINVGFADGRAASLTEVEAMTAKFIPTFASPPPVSRSR